MELNQQNKREQNRTRDMEIKNKLTVTRGDVGGDIGGKGTQPYLNHNKKKNYSTVIS